MHDGLRVVDADGHTAEPREMWQKYLDPGFRGRVRLTEDGSGAQLLVDDRPVFGLTRDDLLALRFTPEEVVARYGDLALNGFDAPGVVRALEVEGVDLTVIYGPIYALWADGMDPALAAAMARGYNRWLAEYSAQSGGRITGAAPLPVYDVGLALRELRYAYDELGLRAFWLRPNPINGRLAGDPYYDPIYAALEELDAPLSLHEGAGAALPSTGRDRFPTWIGFHAIVHPAEQMMALQSLILGGTFDRFPRLRVAFMESGCSWLPYWLYRMDEHFELVGWKMAPDLKLKPSEYFRRQGYISFEPDEWLVRHVIEAIGDERIVFATDFPHPDAKYPKAVATFLELPGISRENQRKILWDNAMDLYRFDRHPFPGYSVPASVGALTP
jgi:predicted TIM-barrel fold metal-dependent hydrolase